MQTIEEAASEASGFHSKAGRGTAPSGQGMTGISGTFCGVLDLAALSAALVVPVFASFLSQQRLGLQGFFELRISIRNILAALLCIAIWRGILVACGLYAMQRKSYFSIAARLFGAVTGCTLVGATAFRLSDTGVGNWRAVVGFWLLSLMLLSAIRLVLILLSSYVRPGLRVQRNLIIVGSGPLALKAYADMRQHQKWDYKLLGLVDSEPQRGRSGRRALLGGLDQLEEILMASEVDDVLIALPIKSGYAHIERAIAICERAGIQPQYSTDLFRTTIAKRRFAEGNDSRRMVLQLVHHDYRRYVKRAIDIAVSLAMLLVLSPLLLVVAALVAFTSDGPIIFAQERFGMGKRKFKMLKFRSMVVDAEALQAKLEHLNENAGPAFKIKSDPRVTRVGAFIRKTSIDELPQLLNVLMGDMSLVGPRPLPTRDVSRFSEAWLMRRFSVKPDLTCIWQVTGRSGTGFDRWIEQDLEYIDTWSLALDAMILFKTVPAVFRGTGAS